MKSSEELRAILNRIDHRGYPAYKELKGSYQFPDFILSIDHVQGDPFASPSKVSVLVRGRQAAFPERLYDRPWRKRALEDHLLRLFGRQADNFAFKARGSGKSGLIAVSRCGQEILSRSACEVNDQCGDVLIRMEVGFPANGRTINARELIRIFYDFLPVCVKCALYYRGIDKEKAEAVMRLSEDQHFIREEIREMGLIAFVANGAILPRESGISQRPLKGAVAFVSPKSMEVTLDLPFAGKLTGMGIAQGVTLIAGGGYHGKSTLLEALERGVYDHIAGDGREYVITDETAMKIRAEDGRSIKAVDISMFINGLPNGKDTTRFDTDNASGSTSQAANMVEAMESGSRLLLIDEDTSASNFMVRDALMQQVIAPADEPIMPLAERIRELYDSYGISMVIVAGSSGAFFGKADRILQMKKYSPLDITAFAKEKAEAFREAVVSEEAAHVASDSETVNSGKTIQSSKDLGIMGAEHAVLTSVASGDIKSATRSSCSPNFQRVPVARIGGSRRGGQPDESPADRVKIKSSGRDSVTVNRETIDLRYVEQLVDSEQLTALGYMLAYASAHLMDGRHSMREVVGKLNEIVAAKGLREICEKSYLPSGLAMPRTQEIFACFNRYRGLSVQGTRK